MADSYFSANRFFDAVIERGALTSIKCGMEDASSEFVLPGTLFGELALTYEKQGEELKQWYCNRSDEFTDAEPIRRGNVLCYNFETEDPSKIFKVSCKVDLTNDILSQVYTIKNISDKPVKILDAALSMTPNSSFEWGESAGNKVIGHPFIGGHGSHSLITRCDGKGKFLLVLPYSTNAGEPISHAGKWEFFDQGADLPYEKETAKQRNRLYVYEYSEHETNAAITHGYKPKIDASSKTLLVGEETCLGFVYMWAEDYADARAKYVSYGIPDIITIPGYTVCKGTSVKMCVRNDSHVSLKPEFSADTECKVVKETEGESIYELTFSRLGENYVDVIYGAGRFVRCEFFVTESIETMIKKRGAFIASHQIKDESLWYDGLLAEWNNESGALLSPDNYDKIKGWRIYEVTCDDPGLSKPAFLSGKLAEYPVQEEVTALDYYIEKFVIGGLQCTEEEDYPFGIYGIPDWHKNRNSDDPGNGGREHLWRIYDYPHIALMYFNMYRIARDYEHIKTRLSAKEYLLKAFGTAVALFTIPYELEEWSAYETGLYNELVIPKIIEALKVENMPRKAARLERHWNRKAKFFVTKCKDLFGSEYPFDTTGFESTHALAKTALKLCEYKKREDRFNPQITRTDTVKFLESQMKCNVACRGYLEPAYFWYGSDYRANNHHYTLSYMSQMGGWAVLDYALRYEKDPFPLLRLGYGSIQSSWALFNSGYFFEGSEHDGAASGGFEPLPYGETWLEQPHSSGPWYYSCEIDLGFCGALRAAATILCEDPIFGLTVYGGRLKDAGDFYEITSEDGVGRRFHVVTDRNRFHFSVDKGHFSKTGPIKVSKDYKTVTITLDTSKLKKSAKISISADCGDFACKIFASGLEFTGEGEIPVTGDVAKIKITSN